MVPVVPFSVWFAAIVAAQAPECYTTSGHLIPLPECIIKPPELSMTVIPTPKLEEELAVGDTWYWHNHDVWRRGLACHFPGVAGAFGRGLPPYKTHDPSLFPPNSDPESDCIKPRLEPTGPAAPPPLSDYKEGEALGGASYVESLLRVQTCLLGRRDICPIDELRPVYHGPAASDQAWAIFIR
jgi:hypothetical protein